MKDVSAPSGAFHSECACTCKFPFHQHLLGFLYLSDGGGKRVAKTDGSYVLDVFAGFFKLCHLSYSEKRNNYILIRQKNNSKVFKWENEELK